jgi:hypothetical protein
MMPMKKFKTAKLEMMINGRKNAQAYGNKVIVGLTTSIDQLSSVII